MADMEMKASIELLMQKFEWLSTRWGRDYAMKAAIVLERGTLQFKRRGKKWAFTWLENGSREPIPLEKAGIEVRLDVAHALPDLLHEIKRGRERRLGDIEEAHAVLDGLLADTEWHEKRPDLKGAENEDG